jgi:hypothetical protein
VLAAGNTRWPVTDDDLPPAKARLALQLRLLED